MTRKGKIMSIRCPASQSPAKDGPFPDARLIQSHSNPGWAQTNPTCAQIIRNPAQTERFERKTRTILLFSDTE